MKRRELLIRTGALALGGGAALAGFPLGWTPAPANAQSDQNKRRLLVFTKSSGFEHSVIKRTPGEALSLAEKTVTEMGLKNGFEVVCTKDGTVFTPENIKTFDAFYFYTTGDLTTPGTDKNPPMTPEGKAAFLEAIRNGKGFIGTHATTDSFHTKPETPDRANRYINHGKDSDPYVQMLGGEFIIHGKQQKSRMIPADRKFPGFQDVPEDGFEWMEEWYSLKDFADNLHVLLVQETKGMVGPMYQRAPYPATWARMHDKGRVFYTSMGHREDVWANPLFQSILLGGLSWVLGNTKADVKPNRDKVAPGSTEIPPKGT